MCTVCVHTIVCALSVCIQLYVQCLCAYNCMCTVCVHTIVCAQSVCIQLYVPMSTASLFIVSKAEATESLCSRPRFYLTFYRNVALATKLISQSSVNFRSFRNSKFSFAFHKPASFIRFCPSRFTYLKRWIRILCFHASSYMGFIRTGLMQIV